YLVGAGLVASIVVLSGGTQSPYFVVFYLLILLPSVFFCHRPLPSLALVAALEVPALAVTFSNPSDPTLVWRASFFVLIGVMSFFSIRANYRYRLRDFETAESLRRAN